MQTQFESHSTFYVPSDRPSFPEKIWENGTRIFKIGPNEPKTSFSIKGQIYEIVKEAGEGGITGNELVRLCRQRVRSPRTHHAQSKPDVGWLRGYITGMARDRYRFLVIEDSRQMEDERLHVA